MKYLWKKKIINMTSETLKESNDGISVPVECWASQFTELGNKQRVLARRIWANVLFHGRMNRLTEMMVEDINQVLKGTSNTSTLTPYCKEYSPEPQFTFMAYQQNDEPLISLPTKSEQCDVRRQNPSTDLPSISTIDSLASRSIITNNDVIQRSLSTPTNLKEYIVSFANDNENQNILNNSDEIEKNIEEVVYEDMKFEVDDEDMMRSIDYEDDSHDEMNNKTLSQNPQENNTLNSAKEKSETAITRKNIKEKNINDDERRESNLLQRRSIEEVEYEDIEYEDDDDDMMISIDHEDNSHDEKNNKNLCQNPEENRTLYSAKEKLETTTTRKYIKKKKSTVDERRELNRLQRRRNFICDQCGKHFTDQSNFNRHRITHSGIKNYECEECNAQYYTAHQLKRHSLMHRNSPPIFACQYCERKFFSSDLRLQHEKSHFKERRFHCQYCDKSFFTKDQQKGHELVHTRIRKYHCKLCDQHFFRGTHLTRHYNSKAHKNNEQQNK